MRKVIFLGALFLALSIASGAGAQVRDPFDPLIDPAGSGGAVTAPEGAEAPTVEPAPQVTSDRLADTGFDPAPYLVAAYGLLALGAGALFLAKSDLYPGRRTTF